MIRSISAVGIALCLIQHLMSVPTLFAQEKAQDRWEKEISGIEERIASGKSPVEAILFVGSSSIRKWKLDESFPDLKTANHGFGGSQLSDSVDYFERIVTPVKPSVIVIYAGDNDIASGKTAETVGNDFRAFIEKVEKQLPACRKVLYLSIKPSIKRWALAEKMQDTNSSVGKVCESSPRLEFVDIWPAMLNKEGKPQADLFVEDGLHLNDQGYAIWTKILRTHLESIEATAESAR